MRFVKSSFVKSRFGCTIYNLINRLNWNCRYLFISIFSGDISRGFGGDGFKCVPIESCTNNPLICDANADCTMIGDFKIIYIFRNLKESLV